MMVNLLLHNLFINYYCCILMIKYVELYHNISYLFVASGITAQIKLPPMQQALSCFRLTLAQYFVIVILARTLAKILIRFKNMV